MTKSVRSEVGQLQQVIVHRPGLELARLTPSNIGDLLFDDVMWAAHRQPSAPRLAADNRGPRCDPVSPARPRHPSVAP